MTAILFSVALALLALSGQTVSIRYDGCGSRNLFCLGFPPNCEQSKSCDFLFKSTLFRERNQVVHELTVNRTRVGEYVAVGLSLDTEMGNDSTTACVHGQDGQVRIQSGFNLPEKDNENRDIKGIVSLSARKNGDRLNCVWSRNVVTEHDGQTWDLSNGHHLMLASGDTDSESRLGYHGDNKMVTASPVKLVDFTADTQGNGGQEPEVASSTTTQTPMVVEEPEDSSPTPKTPDFENGPEVETSTPTPDTPKVLNEPEVENSSPLPETPEVSSEPKMKVTLDKAPETDILPVNATNRKHPIILVHLFMILIPDIGNNTQPNATGFVN
ncbi:putative ferric-chelate reductase 1 -like protein [Halotydeus destructor]|nr:putative ferric-chelate reductase 1 -like protein [Halotydeus destructor]